MNKNKIEHLKMQVSALLTEQDKAREPLRNEVDRLICSIREEEEVAYKKHQQSGLVGDEMVWLRLGNQEDDLRDISDRLNDIPPI